MFPFHSLLIKIGVNQTVTLENCSTSTDFNEIQISYVIELQVNKYKYN